jgi:predicted GNAT family N-acyltransferase
MNESRSRVEEVAITDRSCFQAVEAIRKKVFVDEQEVAPEEEFDEFESTSKHYLLFVNSIPVATARWRYIDDKIKCERFALLKEYRNMGYGSILLKHILNEISGKSDEVYLHAQLKAIPFYERQGFQKIGEQFSECDILHYKMILNT